MDAFERVSLGATEMMLVSGYSGIGKSLVNEVHKPIVAARGYFISGKFDQFKRNIPYVSKHSRNWCSCTESADKIAVWQAKLLAAFGANGQVIDVIPKSNELLALSQLCLNWGQLNPKIDLIGCFNNLFMCLATWTPAGAFPDDLQWRI